MEELKEVTLKSKVRKISRAYYLLIPASIVREMDIKSDDETIILLNKKNKILAFKFPE